MKFSVTKLLAEFCLENGVDIEYVCREAISVLEKLGINTEKVEIDLGAPLNSHCYRNNSETFTILIDPVSVSNVKDGIEFKEALHYELAHEMSHSVISQDLHFLENATLQVGWFLNNGFPIDQALKATVKNSLENIKIDGLLVENPMMMRGFYTRQFQEYANTKKYLKSKPLFDNDFIWLEEFLGISRRALVSKKARDLDSCKGKYRVLDMSFRSQSGTFLSHFNSKPINEVWEFMKASSKNQEDYLFEIYQRILALGNHNN